MCLPGSREARPWDPADSSDRALPDLDYFGDVCAAFERDTLLRGLTVYVTWDVTRLPSYGQNVVAIVLGDESARYPVFASRIRAVFKCYGLSRGLPAALRMDVLSGLSYAQELRTAALSMPHVAHRIRAAATMEPANVWDVPLGYYKQLDLPLVPIGERGYDVFFAGSARQRDADGALANVRLPPKDVARHRMIAALESYAATHRERRVEIRTTAHFLASVEADTREYSERLMNAKVCVVPRGTSLETFRWFEGMRYGCVVICEALPKRRYYEGAPALQLTDWRDLGALLERLFANPAELLRISAQSRRWWEDRCSPAVTAAYMSERLTSQR